MKACSAFALLGVLATGGAVAGPAIPAAASPLPAPFSGVPGGATPAQWGYGPPGYYYAPPPPPRYYYAPPRAYYAPPPRAYYAPPPRYYYPPPPRYYYPPRPRAGVYLGF